MTLNSWAGLSLDFDFVFTRSKPYHRSYLYRLLSGAIVGHKRRDDDATPPASAISERKADGSSDFDCCRGGASLGSWFCPCPRHRLHNFTSGARRLSLYSGIAYPQHAWRAFCVVRTRRNCRRRLCCKCSGVTARAGEQSPQPICPKSSQLRQIEGRLDLSVHLQQSLSPNSSPNSQAITRKLTTTHT
jgi:hypothetical protein